MCSLESTEAMQRKVAVGRASLPVAEELFAQALTRLKGLHNLSTYNFYKPDCTTLDESPSLLIYRRINPVGF